MKKFWVLNLLALLLAGCGTTGEKVYLNRDIPVNTKLLYSPALDESNSITPGESMISTVEVSIIEGIELQETVNHTGTFNGFDNTYIVQPGQLELIATNSNGKFFGGARKLRHIVSASSTNKTVGGGIFIPYNETSNHSVFIDNISAATENLGRKVTHKSIEITSFVEDGFKQELIYSGKASGDTIMIEYREFKGNYARPAFSQSLMFDISEDNVVGFRGALFEVISASNSRLEYKVLQHLK